MADLVIDLGATIPGECAWEGYTGKVVCTSVSFNSTQEVERGRNATRTIHTVNIEDITVSRLFDKSSPAIWKALITGSTIATAYIYVLKASAKGGSAFDWFVKYTLTNVLIAGQNLSFGESEVTDEITLNCTKIKVEYKAQDSTGAVGSVTATATYDIQKGKPE